MNTDDSTKVVRAAYEYLVKILLAGGTTTDKISNFRIDELTKDSASTNFKMTLSYDVAGDFAFDKKREYREFEVQPDGLVLSMKIRQL